MPTANKRRYRNMLVVFAYFAITVFMTYPLILNFVSHVPAVGNDAFGNLWNMWWLKTSLIDLGTTPYYTSYLFHPNGISLVFHTLSFFNSLAAIPLQDVIGLTGTYNVLFLFGFVFSGYGTYLLVKYLTGDRRAAFVAGIIFAFCPYRFAHAFAGHLNLMGTQWIPFYVLYLIRTYRETGKRNPIYAGLFLFATTLCDWHYMGFMLIFTGFFLAYHFWFERKEFTAEFLKRFVMLAFMFSIVVLPFAYPMLLTLADPDYSADYPKIEFAATYSADLLSYFLPSSLHPLFSSYVKGIYDRFSGNIAEYTLALGYTVIALVLYYQLKSGQIAPLLSDKMVRFRTLFKNKINIVKLAWILLIIAAVYYFAFGLDWIVYPLMGGYALFFVALFYLVKDKKIDFWSLAAIFFGILSLGPVLHILGKTLFGKTELMVVLPGILLYIIPIFSFLRDPGRFGLIVMLAMAVLSGYSLADIFGRVKKKNLVMIFVSALILFEFLAAPLTLTDTKIPEFYKNISAEDGKFAVLEVPTPVFCNGYSQVMYYQSEHEKSIFSGMVSIVPTGTEDFLANTPVIQGFASPVTLGYSAINGRDAVVLIWGAYFRPDAEYNAVLEEITNGTPVGICSGDSYYFLESLRNSTLISELNQSYAQGDILRQNNSIIGQSVLSHYSIRYIVVHEEYFTPATLKAINSIVSEVMRGEPPVYADSKIRFYRIGREDAMFMTLGGGWYPKELLEQTATRWMSNNAALDIINAKNRTARLEFDARSLAAGRRLRVYLGDTLLGEYRINVTYTHVDVGSIRLAKGNNTLIFYTPDGCEKQRARLQGGVLGYNSRCASLAFQNISITPEAGD